MEQINRYSIRRGPFNEYELYDHLENNVLLTTKGLNREGDEDIAKKIVEYAYNQVTNTPTPRKKKLTPFSQYTTGGGQAKDDRGNFVELDNEGNVVSVNDQKPTSSDVEYYHRVYGVDVVEEKDSRDVVDKIFEKIFPPR